MEITRVFPQVWDGKVNADNDYHLPEQSSGTPLDPREFAHESIE